MLLKDKQTIETLRKENYSYACIAKTLGLSPNTVKSICRRNGYVPVSYTHLDVYKRQHWYRPNAQTAAHP